MKNSVKKKRIRSTAWKKKIVFKWFCRVKGYLSLTDGPCAVENEMLAALLGPCSRDAVFQIWIMKFGSDDFYIFEAMYRC